ncbi:DUF928 domain-containing protein [Microcoleus sp. CAWBG58]|uniref:DUF928 domain-containing protein n=1 Tax=Microcoleus sp. CAWBG58 TaxID=2841651 RepID=UPI0025DF421A|nr:DUF928 domain-containing protein [Microcoleus sp. CAWBG58]
MNNLRQFYRKKTLPLILALIFADLFGLMLEVRSQTVPKYNNTFATKKTNQSKRANRFQAPPPPSGRDERPVKRKDAGSSGSCEGLKSQQTEFLTALVPKQNYQALTVASHPTFWFYIPFPAQNFHSLKFRLETADGYQVTVKPKNEKPGIVSFTLPATQKPLEVGKEYKWALFLYCQDSEQKSSRPVTFFVSSSIKRITPSNQLENELKAATTEAAKSAVYARNGIWHEALTLIGNRRRADSTNPELARDWANLLSSVQLEDIATKPFIDL